MSKPFSISREDIERAFSELVNEKRAFKKLPLSEQKLKNYRFGLKQGKLSTGIMLDVLNSVGRLSLKDDTD